MSDDPESGEDSQTMFETESNLETEDDTEEHSGESTREQFERYLTYATLALFVLFALVAAFGVYTSLERAISIWVTSEYRPFFRAGFNLVVLFIAVGGAARVIRRLD